MARASDTLSLAQARRIALAAQGFADKAPSGSVDKRHLARVLGRIGLLQLDSVNVLVRSHYLPVFSRLGPYSADLLDRLSWDRRHRALFEYWGHEASLLPVAMQPLFRWRMDRAARGDRIYKGIARFGAENRAYIGRVLDEVRSRGPLAVSDLPEGAKNHGSWWGWGEGKTALEWLFWAGQVTTSTRRGFERLYDLPERVLPPEILNAPTPAETDAQRALMLIAARAHGVATEPDLRDYFRLPPEESKARLAELVEAGAVLPVKVEGWRETAYLHAEAAIPRRIEAHALLSPFDPVVWMRPRAERLFDFHYRIAFYTPKDKRQHGYYVLPFLLGDRLVARIDLKSDRQGGRLQVLGAHVEDHTPAAEIAPPLAADLLRMAAWLGLAEVQVAAPGPLGSALGAALKAQLLR